MAAHDAAQNRSSNHWTGLGLSLGAGAGVIAGLLIAGGDGIALGICLGAGVGVALGAARDGIVRLAWETTDGQPGTVVAITSTRYPIRLPRGAAVPDRKDRP